ncbi:MAG: glycosyltransferase [Flavobacteriales bacterium]|nr:glycosyltransferase [Flavobacteriales bacterium]
MTTRINQLDPELSVIVCAYNIDGFIGACLDSILAQKVDFQLEILVGDDGSTDDTRNIISKYAHEHPDIITPVFRDKNLGYSANFIDLLERSSGKYFAQVDGDDFLSDKTKFQTQADILNRNPNVSVCFHHYVDLLETSKTEQAVPSPFEKDTIVGFEYLLNGPLGPGNTCMVRRSALPSPIPTWVRESANHMDFSIHALSALRGDIYYLNKVMSVYRKHETNITKVEKSETLFLKSIMINEGILNDMINLGIGTYQNTLRWIINQRKLRLSFHYLDRGMIGRFFRYFIPSILKIRYWNLRVLKDSIYQGAPILAGKVKRIVP